MEQDVVFLRSKEVGRRNAIRSLQEVWLSGRQIAGEIGGIKSWLKEPIHAQAKKGLTDEERARIGNLGIEPLPVERGSLTMSQSRPSRQPTIGLHGAGAGAANLHHPRCKIESIDLTNDSGSERGPPSAAYHTSPSPIITTESERMGSARKFSSDHQVVRQPHGQECRSAFVYQDYNPYNSYEYQASPPTRYEQYDPSNAPQAQAQGPQGHVSWAAGSIE